ncbi:hypothetical protein [Sulfurimonas indica]|uniref:hypothetical protein n=1 Tax=Sulfurimonas indica TaxID=2508707 RepID=UPI001263F661|nr:hypothetical protein [Sulfurimonas indica]
MKAQSSIHFAKGNSSYFSHNDRSCSTKNSIFQDEENEVLHNAKESLKIYKNELKIRAEAYFKRTNQQLQKNVVTHRSAIVNLNQHHILNDLKLICEKIEQDLDTKILQVAIHKDEGRYKNIKYFDTKIKVKNYHAHIEIMGIDSNGISIAQNSFDKNGKRTRKRLDKSFYIEMQDFVAKTLGMIRGKKGSKRKRLDTYDFKEAMEQQEKAIAVKNTQISRLKEENGNKKLEIKKYKKENEILKNKIQDLQQITLKQQITYQKDLKIQKENNISLKSELTVIAEKIKKTIPPHLMKEEFNKMSVNNLLHVFLKLLVEEAKKRTNIIDQQKKELEKAFQQIKQLEKKDKELSTKYSSSDHDDIEGFSFSP